ncbi:hypothetical protein [Ilumatobacter nonamiensis]|uniref:hypothetical protein n=1 Tax=Ilumatobacter nonamiensis TaxID=467093 RepID=UPI00034AC3FD|nr:hypothetical protein [Ilumatobacter nonamiensis]
MGNARRALETAATTVVAGLFGGAVGSLVGAPVVGAVLAGANGAISGWRRTYDWTCSSGLVAFILDSTWSLPMTAAGVFANGVGLMQRDAGYVPELSTRQNRHVYRRGFTPRKGFATTLGNVIGGAGDVDRPRRRRLVTDHEDVHCWQARWLGPLYPLVYVGWTVLGGAVGMVIWLVRRRDERFTKVVETVAYYANPIEWWAYCRDDHWPPSSAVVGLVWRRRCCRPLAVVRLER